MSSRLMELARAGSSPEPPAVLDACELCGEPLPAEHRHLLDLERRRPLCACRACVVLFDHTAAGGGHYRLIGEQRRRLDDFRLDDAVWDGLRIPVDMAFFERSSSAARVLASYPGPMGTTESLLELEAWREIEAANPVLAALEPDVEALLVNRARGAREHWLVPIDDCYRLAGIMRTRWRGLGGGHEVFDEIERFFDRLKEETTWRN